jgi:hypothetical protein
MACSGGPPEHRDGALVRVLQAEQHVDGGRLPRAVRAEQRYGLALADGDVDPASGVDGAAR